MGLQDFIVRQTLKSKLKNVPKDQQELIFTLVQKDPELFKKMGTEIERRTKGGENQMKASMEVFKKYRAEVSALMGKK